MTRAQNIVVFGPASPNWLSGRNAYVPDAPGRNCFAWERIDSRIRLSTLHRRHYEVPTLPLLLGLIIVLNLVLLLWVVLHQRSNSSQDAGIKGLVGRTEGLQQALTQQLSSATADMASRR